MYDAEIGLEKNESISLKLNGGSIFVWNNNGVVSVSLNSDGQDTLSIMFDAETLEVHCVTSPHDRIKIPVKSWPETTKSNLYKLGTQT